jgi:preprotein translocase subunit SecE
MEVEWGGVLERENPAQRREETVSKPAANTRLQNNAIVGYLRETWFELKKVSWPTRSEAVNLTIIVIVATAFLAAVLSAMDFVFAQAFSLILG